MISPPPTGFTCEDAIKLKILRSLVTLRRVLSTVSLFEPGRGVMSFRR